MEWIVQLPVLLFSVAVHELFKGLAARALGDRTAEEQGRLTLNPIPHLDPFGTVFLPLLCYAMRLPMLGWAKPLEPSPSAKASESVRLAAAGPLAHAGLALVTAACYKAAVVTHVFAPEFEKTMLDALVFGVSLNLVLAFFNLLPVHPLDASRAVAGLLPAPWRGRYEAHAPYAGYFLAVLLGSRLLDPVVMRPARAALEALAKMGLLS
ncbi:MAG: site-2 protease family protein [Elusimicrobia bacterium]|nr:site-2 protease family protein [Elusimicrobiota bacterium]